MFILYFLGSSGRNFTLGSGINIVRYSLIDANRRSSCVGIDREHDRVKMTKSILTNGAAKITRDEVYVEFIRVATVFLVETL